MQPAAADTSAKSFRAAVARSAGTPARRAFNTRAIGVGVVCVLILITLGAARRRPPSEAEVARLVEKALADPGSSTVAMPDQATQRAVDEAVQAHVQAQAEAQAAPRSKPAVQTTLPAATQPLRAAAMTTATTHPETVVPVAIESKPAAAPSSLVERPALAPAAASTAAPAAPAASPVTVSGCLTESKDGFVLKKASGDAVSRSRSWTSGFLRKSSPSIGLVDEANVLRASFVGRRVETTGILEDGEMQVRSMRVGGPCE